MFLRKSFNQDGIKSQALSKFGNAQLICKSGACKAASREPASGRWGQAAPLRCPGCCRALCLLAGPSAPHPTPTTTTTPTTTPTPRSHLTQGRFASELSTGDELVLTEMVFAGKFKDLRWAGRKQSWAFWEARRRTPARRPAPPSPVRTGRQAWVPGRPGPCCQALPSHRRTKPRRSPCSLEQLCALVSCFVWREKSEVRAAPCSQPCVCVCVPLGGGGASGAPAKAGQLAGIAADRGQRHAVSCGWPQPPPACLLAATPTDCPPRCLA